MARVARCRRSSGRDTDALDSEGVATAAIESLVREFLRRHRRAGLLVPRRAGCPGLCVCKAINTADSLIGHKDERYRAFGWAAARADDVVNLIPARIAGLLICAAGLRWRAHDASRCAASTPRRMAAGRKRRWPACSRASSAARSRTKVSRHLARCSATARARMSRACARALGVYWRACVAALADRGRRRMAAVMLQGTGSDVGKSVLVAGLCRLFTNRGLRVRPFKPQNMSNNAAVAADGGEIGRAQALQAIACRTPPSVDMNPVLIKPQSDTGAQLIVHGRVRGHSGRTPSTRARSARCSMRCSARIERLRAQADLVVVEGAGSPAEINLRAGDIANMGFARAANVPVVLVGDIDRGGVIASLVGTRAVLDADGCRDDSRLPHQQVSRRRARCSRPAMPRSSGAPAGRASASFRGWLPRAACRPKMRWCSIGPTPPATARS